MASVVSRVLVVGGRAPGLAGRLEARGYACEAAPRGDGVQGWAGARPDAVVLASTARLAPRLLAEVRQHPVLRRVPVLIDGSEGWRASLRRLDVDGVAESFEALERQLAASVKARRLADLDALIRRRLELLLELSRLSASGASLEVLVQSLVGPLAEALSCERAAVLCIEGSGPHRARLCDGEGQVPIDLAVSPALRRALESRTPVQSDGAWIHPLTSQDRGVAALVLRREAPLEREESDFLDALGSGLASALELQAVRAGQARGQEALEDAYVERYRELVEANHRLRAVDRKKNEILAVLSHDLRAPLNVLLGHAHLLLVENSLSSTQRASAEAIQRSGRKVLGLVESLLEQARGDDGRIVLFTGDFDIAEACQDVVRDLQILAAEKGVILRAETPLSVDVRGDEQKIRQVVQNLLTNALTHARGVTSVVVRAQLRRRPDGDVALVEVRDDGQLADPSALLLAFERSAGLGLSICRDFVERHGGEIWAEAPPEGGAQFAFTLPVAGQHAPARPVRRSEPLVLLVDDDPIFSRMASMALAGHYRVETARDGNEAVARARQLVPDAIVMDVFMPNRDGLDALRELQSRPETQDIPVILLSSRPELPQRIRPAELGAADFVAKPMPPAVLLRRVGAAVQRSRAHARSPSGPGNDAETGLYDHLGLVERLDQEIDRGVRSGRALTLVVLKPLRPPGELVSTCAAVVRRELPPPDFVAHLGGGVLIVGLPETPGPQAEPLVGRLVGLLADARVAYRARHVEVTDEAGGAEALLERVLA